MFQQSGDAGGHPQEAVGVASNGRVSERMRSVCPMSVRPRLPASTSHRALVANPVANRSCPGVPGSGDPALLAPGISDLVPPCGNSWGGPGVPEEWVRDSLPVGRLGKMKRHNRLPNHQFRSLKLAARGTLSHAACFAVDSLSRSCSGVNLSTSHQLIPSGQGTPKR
jgi:hypothetical protein